MPPARGQLIPACAGPWLKSQRVYPPVHLAKVPVSNFITFMMDCSEPVGGHCAFFAALHLQNAFIINLRLLLLQPNPLHTEVFKIVIEPCSYFDSSLSHIHET